MVLTAAGMRAAFHVDFKDLFIQIDKRVAEYALPPVVTIHAVKANIVILFLRVRLAVVITTRLDSRGRLVKITRFLGGG